VRGAGWGGGRRSQLSERVSDCRLTPNEIFVSYVKARTSYIQWNDYDDVLE